MRYALALLAILLFPTGALADQLTLSRQVLLPNGKPAVGAKVFVRTYARYNFPKVKPQAIETKTDQEGRYKVTIDDQPGMAGYLVIDAPGAALHLNVIGSLLLPGKGDDDSDRLTLSQAYFVQGRALDENGLPIGDATISLAVLFPETYTPLQLTPRDFGDAPQELQARTDRDGRYRFRGIDGFGSIIPGTTKVEAYATGDWQGNHYLGSGQIDFDPKSKEPAGEPNLITMHPLGDISARVIDGISGKPISGAIAQISTNDVWTPLSNMIVHTYDAGTFEAKGRPAETNIRINKPGYAASDISFPVQEADGATLPPSPRSVTIVLNPLVPLTVRVFDAETGKAPLIPPVGLSASQSRNLEGGATEMAYGERGAPLMGSLFPPFTYIFEAPVGHDKLNFEYPEGYSTPPYEKSQDFDMPANGMKNVTITLHRQPGILFKLDINDPDRVNIMSPKNDIEIDITRSGEPDEIYEGYLATEFFFPVDKWGETVAIRILERHKDGSKTDLIPPATYTADPKIWPVTIKVPPASPESASGG